GAGISGAVIAERLSREGLDGIVLDKREVAGGSTSASTALLQYEIDTPLTELTKKMGRKDAERAYRACYKSIDATEKLAESLKIDCGFERRRSVYLASKASHAPLLLEEWKARKEAGISVKYLEKQDIEKRFSFSREAALLSDQAAQMDCYRFTHGLLQRAVAHGARIFDRTHVVKQDTNSKPVRLTTDKGNTVTCKQVIFAMGYEAQKLLPPGLVKMKSTYAMASEPLEKFPGWWKRCLLWETARPYFYMRTTQDGRAIIGGEDDDFRNPERRDALVEKKAKRLEKRFRQMFPDIALEPAYHWAGTFGETKDGLAYIGALPKMPNCQFVLGFGGNGITYSVIASDIIRDALFGKKNKDAHVFRFDR
ncbi:MAG: FAD-dependent oxidoreductase, partial [Chthoniobacterales bacterium]